MGMKLRSYFGANEGSDLYMLKSTRRLAASELPAEWLPIINQEAAAARAYHMRHAAIDPVAQREVWRGYLQEFGGAAGANLSDASIKAQARAYANEAGDIDLGLLVEHGAWQEYERLLNFCEGREVAPPKVALLLVGMGARVRCQYWWRRALRKKVAQKSERGHLAMGLVSAHKKQPYASNQALFRSLDQNERNKSALENIHFENDEGYRRTLAELAATSVSNKAIRRGELMTRIRGCEEIADECGHAGLFITLTTPSRFHSSLWGGGRNPKYDGSTPRQAQDWHCSMWRKARAKLQRQGVKLYGFRVAEPHHDGCTHWHMLIWAEHGLDLIEQTMRDYWLSDDGNAPGAKKHRVTFKAMTKGGAAGYIAKYISKNIDDHQIDSHIDDYTDMAMGVDLLGDMEIKPSMRVEAWAKTWNIRQFQPLGQPPVTVWRELRRIKESQARLAGVGGIVHKAWLAAQKIAGVMACWARYVKAQGGLMMGRRCNLKMRHDLRDVDGLYGCKVQAVPVGVALNIRGSNTVWSERRLWRAVDPAPVLKAERSGAPRTGVHNCTVEIDRQALKDDYARHAADIFKGVEGNQTFESHHGTSKPANRYLN